MLSGEQASPPTRPPLAPAWTWRLQTPGDLTAARLRLRGRLRQPVLPDGADADDVDRLLLAFEELASNALRHGSPPVQVSVITTAEGWLIDAIDAAPDRPPAPAVDRDPAHGGLGLHLIARLAAAHGWSVSQGRKHVWAQLRPASPVNAPAGADPTADPAGLLKPLEFAS